MLGLDPSFLVDVILLSICKPSRPQGRKFGSGKARWGAIVMCWDRVKIHCHSFREGGNAGQILLHGTDRQVSRMTHL